MALSDAKKAADRRHISKLDNIMIRPYKEEGTAIRAAAAVAGQSVQAYVLQAIRERMARDTPGGQEQPPERQDPETGTVQGSQEPQEGTGGISDDAGMISISNGGSGEDQVTSCSSSHTEPVLERPEDLPDEEWREWARQMDGEDDDEWRRRIDRSFTKGFREMARRLELLSKEELAIYKKEDPKSIAKREEEKQKSLARYDELMEKKNAKRLNVAAGELDELKRLASDLRFDLAKREQYNDTAAEEGSGADF